MGPKLVFVCLVLCLAYLSLVAAQSECVCPFNYAPVCGSDGVTYGNQRCMECANPDLRVVKQGPCE